MTPHKNLQIWLYFVAFMIFAMAVIGAVTRLTESGLSMVEWRPVTGFLPPLDAQEWQRVYDLYRQSPEFAAKHYWMELADFKTIYFWEWLHRLWGRLIGLAYALPLFYFWVRRMIPAGYGARLLGLLFLGGMQGFVGWWMVKSGLIDRPAVSHYRLAVHLGLALILFSLVFLTARQLGNPPAQIVPRGVIHHARGVLALLAVTILWGAFTAGLDAGKIYNTWPMMDGAFLPAENFNISSIVDQQGWVQFIHRWIAILTATGIMALALRTKDAALGIMVFAQVGLGIAALLSQLQIGLAALHQAGAIILLALLLRRVQSLRAAPLAMNDEKPTR